MSSAARSLWHQRLAWLLLMYAGAAGMAVAELSLTRPPILTYGFAYAFGCGIVMTCVKDSALRGRPMPYSWRWQVGMLWPIAVWIVAWRARRWWGLLWVAVHGFMIAVVFFVTAICYGLAMGLIF